MHRIDIDRAQRYLERGRSFVHKIKLGRSPRCMRRKRLIQERRNVAEMLKYAGELRVGDVVLLHDSDAYSSGESWCRTVAALPSLLDAIAALGVPADSVTQST